MTACTLKHGRSRAVPDARSRSAESDNVDATLPATTATFRFVELKWRTKRKVLLPKTVVIIGGGAGRATAARFARLGCDVGIIARNEERLTQAAEELSRLGCV